MTAGVLILAAAGGAHAQTASAVPEGQGANLTVHGAALPPPQPAPAPSTAGTVRLASGGTPGAGGISAGALQGPLGSVGPTTTCGPVRHVVHRHYVHRAPPPVVVAVAPAYRPVVPVVVPVYRPVPVGYYGYGGYGYYRPGFYGYPGFYGGPGFFRSGYYGGPGFFRGGGYYGGRGFYHGGFGYRGGYGYRGFGGGRFGYR